MMNDDQITSERRKVRVNKTKEKSDSDKNSKFLFVCFFFGGHID